MIEISHRDDKILVIGLDAAPLDLIKPWMKEKLPNIAKLTGEGVVGNLRSVLPTNSASAWSSMITGKNPGKHGVFNFTSRMENSYDLSVVNATFRRSKDLWEFLSEHGKKVCVINVPITYPPRRVNGILVCGMMTPKKVEDFTWPNYIADELKRRNLDPKFDIDQDFVEGKEDNYLKEAYEWDEKIARTALYFMEKGKWDFFMVVFAAADRIEHAFWEYIDSNHPFWSIEKERRYGDAIICLYEKIDQIIGRMLRIVGQNTNIIIVSDHGMRPIYRWIHLNNLLMRGGFLKLKKNVVTLFKYSLFRVGVTPMNLYALFARLGLAKIRRIAGKPEASKIIKKLFLSLKDVDWSNTQAYANPNLIFVNLQGREPLGIVARGRQYDTIVSKVIRALDEYGCHYGNPSERIFKYISPKKEVYSGPFTDIAPDILALPNAGYGIFPYHQFGSNSVIDEPFGKSGDHSLDGMMIMSGPVFRKGIELNGDILDIAPTILYLMNLPIPTDMDGEVLTEAIAPTYVESHQIKKKQTTAKVEVNQQAYSRKEEEEIKKRLKQLGYLD